MIFGMAVFQPFYCNQYIPLSGDVVGFEVNINPIFSCRYGADNILFYQVFSGC